MRRSITDFPIEGDLTHSQAGECYSQVVDRLLSIKGASKQVLITSSERSEGKTVTAVNLALAFHVRRISVLLAELSFIHPRFSEIFGTSPLPKGIEDVIARGAPLQSTICIRNDNSLNIAMVNKPQKTDDLLQANENLDRVLREAKTSYEWTIFDAPSLETITDIRSVAACVGIVLLIVRARQASEKNVRDALKRIAHPNTFVLLNDE